jgi:hypothetical protein
MFVRLTRRKRVKAGWFAALLYLFCVLAPGVALAVGDAASCLVTKIGTIAAHVHGDSSHQHHAAQGSEHSSHHADAGAIPHEPAKHDHVKHDHAKHDHAKHGHDQASPGPCCAILCVSAIAVDLPAVAKPSQPISVCISENFQRLPGEAPPLLYRPPIA